MATPAFDIRPSAVDDHDAVARTRARANPRWALQRDWVTAPAASAVARPHEWVAVQGADVVGVASHSSPTGRRLLAMVHVDPVARGSGIGTALARHLLSQLTETDHGEAMVVVDDHDEASVRFARRWGVVSSPPVCRMFELDVTRTAVDLVDLVDQPSNAAGVVIRRVDEHDLDNHELVEAIFQANVDSEAEPYLNVGMTPERDDWPEVLARRVRGDGIVVIAELDGRLVGVADATLAVHVPVARTGLTFVRPEVRGNGVGTALKAEVCRWAREGGLERLVSEVHEDNLAIHAANLKLGFVPRPAATWTLPLR